MSVPKHFNKFNRNPAIKAKGGSSPMEGVASVIFNLDPMAERMVLNFLKKHWMHED